MFPITNVETATAALGMIVQEGEGTPDTPLDFEGEYAHYYRFAEIFHGRQLTAEPSSAIGYAYNGPEIPSILPRYGTWRGIQRQRNIPKEIAPGAWPMSQHSTKLCRLYT